MILNKKVIESTVLTGMLVITATVTGATTHVISGTGTVNKVTTIAESTVLSSTNEVTVSTKGTAGVIGELSQKAVETLQTANVDFEQTDVQMVAAGQEDLAADATVDPTVEPTAVQGAVATEVAGALPETTEPALTPEQQEWSTRLMANVDQYLNIRAAADENSELVGKLYVGDVAQIVEAGDTWTHITSGSVDGYVMNSYCVMGADAYAYAQTKCETKATAITGGLRLRSEPNEESSILEAVAEGTVFTVDTATDAGSEWVAVNDEGTTGYVSAQYVSVELSLGTAESVAEEQKRLAAEAAEAAKTSQVKSSGGVAQKGAVAVGTDDVTLLGALIQCEAGSESYDGQLAVGAVVMNRLRSGVYGGSVASVVYAGGQFTPAGSGSVDRVVAGGVKGSCLQAAQDAINGSDNTGGATCFRPVSSGHAGTVIGNHVFW